MVEVFDSSHLPSELWNIRETARAGRGVFALKDIPVGTLLATVDRPVAFVIFHEYRKEICAHCFAYDRGRTWKEHDHEAGLFFCSLICRERWLQEAGEVVRTAYCAVTNLIRKRRATDNDYQKAHTRTSQREFTSETVSQEWERAETNSASIFAARKLSSPTKQQLKSYRKIQSQAVEPDVILYILSFLCSAFLYPESWSSILVLKPTTMPFRDLTDLENHTESYQHLIAVLPDELLSLATSQKIRMFCETSAHNAFDLRSLDDAKDPDSRGTEHFGTGLWPAASYWNHSCAPNVGKSRTGRTWNFWASKHIKKGEQLCITYLGGHEREWSYAERQQKLKQTWDFNCACDKCEAEKC